MIHVRKNAESWDKALLDAFREQPSATVHEAMGRRGALDPPLSRSAPR